MACFAPSHSDLHCLQRYMYWSIGMKSLSLCCPLTCLKKIDTTGISSTFYARGTFCDFKFVFLRIKTLFFSFFLRVPLFRM